VNPIAALLFTNFFSPPLLYNPIVVRLDILIALLLKFQILEDVMLHRLVYIPYAMADGIHFGPKKE
jgi:hypothetical protein